MNVQLIVWIKLKYFSGIRERIIKRFCENINQFGNLLNLQFYYILNGLH